MTSVTEIAIKESNAAALRELLRQINDLNAHVRGAVNALAVLYEVPAHWQFDAERMMFVEPPRAQGAPVEAEGES